MHASIQECMEVDAKVLAGLTSASGLTSGILACACDSVVETRLLANDSHVYEE